MTRFRVDVVVDQLTPLLQDLHQRGEDLGEVMPLIGQSLVDSTKLRFDEGRAPDGTPWAPLALSTILARARPRGAGRGRGGRGRVKVAALGAKPLLDTGVRRNDVHFVADKVSVTIGSSFRWMAVHQFGGKAGRGRRVTIPKREWAGVSNGDRDSIVAFLRDHFEGARP